MPESTLFWVCLDLGLVLSIHSLSHDFLERLSGKMSLADVDFLSPHPGWIWEVDSIPFALAFFFFNLENAQEPLAL